MEYSTFKKIADKYMNENYGTSDVLRKVDFPRDEQIRIALKNLCLQYGPKDLKRRKEFLDQVESYCGDYINSFRG